MSAATSGTSTSAAAAAPIFLIMVGSSAGVERGDLGGRHGAGVGADVVDRAVEEALVREVLAADLEHPVRRPHAPGDLAVELPVDVNLQGAGARVVDADEVRPLPHRGVGRRS